MKFQELNASSTRNLNHPFLSFTLSTFFLLKKEREKKMARSFYVDAHLMSKTYIDNDSDYDSDYDQNEDSNFLRKLNDYVKENLQPARGDIIDTIFEDYRDRNDGKYIFDGKDVIDLDSDVDDYGAVPPQFQITDKDFAIGWWKDTIDHNNIQYLSSEFFRSLNFVNSSDESERANGTWTAKALIRHFVDNSIVDKMTTFVLDTVGLESIKGDYCLVELEVFDIPDNFPEADGPYVFLRRAN